MRGKLGLVVGLGVGYVLGTRAGRQRYEQIKAQWLKVWHLDPVQEKVGQVKKFAASRAAAIPAAVWNGAVKVAQAATDNRATAGQRLDSAIETGKKAAEDVAEAVGDAADEVATAAKKSRKGR